MTATEDFIALELPKRSPLIQLADAGGYDGNPNAAAAPANLMLAPLGSWFREEAAGIWWRRTETVWQRDSTTIRPVSIPLTQRPIFLRSSGDDANDGSTELLAVATFARAQQLWDWDSVDKVRQYIECTGYIGSLDSNAGTTRDGFTIPPGGYRQENDFTRPGAFDNGKSDFTNYPFEFYADPLLVLPVTVLSYNTDAVTLIKTAVVSDTLVVNAHIGQMLITGIAEWGRVVSNTANEIVLAGGSFNFSTGLVGIYEESCEITLNTQWILNALGEYAFHNVKFIGPSNPFIQNRNRGTFINCVFEAGVTVEGPGADVSFIGCYFSGTFLTIENLAATFQECFIDGAVWSNHGTGGSGKNTLTFCTINDCTPYGAGNFESLTDIEVTNCHFSNARTAAIHKQSPSNARLDSLRIDDSGTDGILLDTGGGWVKLRSITGAGQAGWGLSIANGTQAQKLLTVDITGALGDIEIGDATTTWAAVNALAAGESIDDSAAPFPHFCRIFI